uniref:DUF3108 domain-containing protein n=1 Tax=candidate division WOR-3 bacterium TaxID=2052148 RepID=A0A7C6A8I8_UNCW3
MKKLAMVIFSLILLCTFCAKKGGPGLKLVMPNWPDNEINQYQVLVGTEPVGSYLLGIRLGEIEEKPTIELTALTYVKSMAGETKDSTHLVLYQNNLKPIKSEKILTTMGTMLSSTINYTKDKVFIKAKTPMGEKSVDIPFGINHYDNDEITTLLRAVELKPNEEMELGAVTGLGGTSVPIKVKALAMEKLTVPAGEFECNKYQMSLAGRMIEVFYEKTGMKRMVKYSDPQSNMTMELVPSKTIEQKEPIRK